jgi:hypothetical protein
MIALSNFLFPNKNVGGRLTCIISMMVVRDGQGFGTSLRKPGCRYVRHKKKEECVILSNYYYEYLK